MKPPLSAQGLMKIFGHEIWDYQHDNDTKHGNDTINASAGGFGFLWKLSNMAWDLTTSGFSRPKNSRHFKSAFTRSPFTKSL